MDKFMNLDSRLSNDMRSETDRNRQNTMNYILNLATSYRLKISKGTGLNEWNSFCAKCIPLIRGTDLVKYLR
jgi:hypothetical protein